MLANGSGVVHPPLVGGAATVLLTVTVRAADVVTLPAASRATARSACEPFAAPVVLQLIAKGAVVSAEPRLMPFRVNWTDVTPTLSDALAETVTVPLTVAPAVGAERLTVGAVVSLVWLLTVTVRAVDVVTLPAASRATARRVWLPFAAPVVLQLIAYGDVVSGEPRFAPFSVNCTDVTPTLSEALAETDTVPLTVAPAAGAVRLTDGAVVSAAVLTIETVRGDEVVVLPALSRATA